MNWQKTQQKASKNSEWLLQELENSELSDAFSCEANTQFPLLAPSPFIERISSFNLDDPLLKQIFPSQEEEIQKEGYLEDPVGDLKSEKSTGVLHKYHGRVLLIVTGACAIHCRYCFRRHFPYSDNTLTSSKWQVAINHIRTDKSIEEVILSGGDPLTLTDEKLSKLCRELNAIPHLKRLRIHSRIPVVRPERILENNLDWLKKDRLKKIMVLHVNHANEMDKEAVKAISKLKQLNITLLNQSVLLRGVNDSASALIDLSQCLFEQSVLPYYLHQLDPVKGASHFEVTDEKARQLIEEIQTKLPGYMVPKLVREIPGELSKQAL